MNSAWLCCAGTRSATCPTGRTGDRLGLRARLRRERAAVRQVEAARPAGASDAPDRLASVLAADAAPGGEAAGLVRSLPRRAVVPRAADRADQVRRAVALAAVRAADVAGPRVAVRPAGELDVDDVPTLALALALRAVRVEAAIRVRPFAGRFRVRRGADGADQRVLLRLAAGLTSAVLRRFLFRHGGRSGRGRRRGPSLLGQVELRGRGGGEQDREGEDEEAAQRGEAQAGRPGHGLEHG